MVLTINKVPFIKSPVNYTGGKFKLLPQIIPLFPNKINTCIDLFTGGANVGINVATNKIICIDIVEPLISLYKALQSTRIETSISMIEDIIKKYQLTDTYRNGYAYYQCDSSNGLGKVNKIPYNTLKQDYNTLTDKLNTEASFLFFTLIIFGFNNQIRYNSKNEFNIPVGKRDFNSSVRKNLSNFIETIQEKNVEFKVSDFRTIDLNQLGENDFIYADPPYLIKTATYNEQKGWTEKEEVDLLNLLDELHQRKVKFALSNVLNTGEKENILLKNWIEKSKKYKVHDLTYSYNNASYQKKNRTDIDREVLITNY